MPGIFLVLYGVNNIGKSHQLQRLARHLEQAGHSVRTVKFPVYESATGRQLDQILRSGERQKVSENKLQKLFAENRFEFQPTLESWLAAGETVLAEDFVGTSLAWGVAKGADRAFLEEINAKLRAPELEILLTGPRSLDSAEACHLHESQPALLSQVAQNLENLAAEKNWKVVQRREKPAQTAQEIWRVVQDFLKKRSA